MTDARYANYLNVCEDEVIEVHRLFVAPYWQRVGSVPLLFLVFILLVLGFLMLRLGPTAVTAPAERPEITHNNAE